MSNGLGEILERRHLPALDGLRWIAVLTVITYHFGWEAIPGDLGVSGFFVLSGFLITWLLLREHETTGTVSLRDFYVRRTLRIFPAYYAFVALSIANDLWRGDPRGRAIAVPALTYTVNYYNALNGHPASSMAHAWSLAVEEQFYLVWPLLFLFAIPRGRDALTRLLTGAIISVVALRSLLYLSGFIDESYAYNAFEMRFDNLAIGCLLAVALASHRVVRWVDGLAVPAWSPFVTLALLYLSRAQIGQAWHYSAGFTVDAALMAVLIVQLLILHQHRAWRWLGNPVVRYLGVLSYPLYLYHTYGISIGLRMPGPEPVKLLASIAFSVVIAAGSYHFLEKPFLRMKERFRRSDHRPLLSDGQVARQATTAVH